MTGRRLGVAILVVGAAACRGGSTTSVPVCEAESGVEIGESVEGTLASRDDRFDGAFIDYYRIRLSTGQRLTLIQSSRDFDPLLLVFNGDGALVDQAFDEDGSPPGETETASLTRSFGAGCFLVGATVWDRGDTGAYTLDVLEGDRQ